MGLAHGTIGWADVAVPDMTAGSAFYEGLFGWQTHRNHRVSSVRRPATAVTEDLTNSEE